MKLHKSEIASIKIARANKVKKWERFQLGPHMGAIEDSDFRLEPINLEDSFKRLQKARRNRAPGWIGFYLTTVAILFGGRKSQDYDKFNDGMSKRFKSFRK